MDAKLLADDVQIDEEPPVALFSADGSVPELKDIDPTMLVKDESLDLDPPAWSEFFSDCLGIMLAIVSMMSAASEFKADVRPDIVKGFGEDTFGYFIQVLTFFPLVYMLLIFLRYNNQRSLQVFNEYLVRGVVVDFPDSEAGTFLVSHFLPVIFIIVTMLYSAFAAIMFIYFAATTSVWILFFKQLLFDIILLWKGLQTVEGSVVTLNQFIEAFDDRDSDAVLDDYTTRRAAAMVSRLRPARARESYLDYTSKFGVNRATAARRWLFRFGMLLFITGMCTAAYFYFVFEGHNSDVSEFKSKVNPCAVVCFDRTGSNTSSCFGCVCDCVTAFGMDFDDAICRANVAVPGCVAEQACTSPAGQACGRLLLP